MFVGVFVEIRVRRVLPARIPYYPTADNTCGVDVPDEVLSRLGWLDSLETHAWSLMGFERL